jgi:hypothetical protein
VKEVKGGGLAGWNVEESGGLACVHAVWIGGAKAATASASRCRRS